MVATALAALRQVALRAPAARGGGVKWRFTDRATGKWLVVRADVWYDARDVARVELRSSDLDDVALPATSRVMPDVVVLWQGTDAGQQQRRQRVVRRMRHG